MDFFQTVGAIIDGGPPRKTAKGLPLPRIPADRYAKIGDDLFYTTGSCLIATTDQVRGEFQVELLPYPSAGMSGVAAASKWFPDIQKTFDVIAASKRTTFAVPVEFFSYLDPFDLEDSVVVFHNDCIEFLQSNECSKDFEFRYYEVRDAPVKPVAVDPRYLRIFQPQWIEMSIGDDQYADPVPLRFYGCLGTDVPVVIVTPMIEDMV